MNQKNDLHWLAWAVLFNATAVHKQHRHGTRNPYVFSRKAIKIFGEQLKEPFISIQSPMFAEVRSPIRPQFPGKRLEWFLTEYGPLGSKPGRRCWSARSWIWLLKLTIQWKIATQHGTFYLSSFNQHTLFLERSHQIYPNFIGSTIDLHLSCLHSPNSQPALMGPDIQPALIGLDIRSRVFQRYWQPFVLDIMS